MIESLREMPYGAAYTAGVLVVLIFQAVALWRLVLCRRRQTIPPPALQLLVVLAGLAIPVLAAVVVHAARSEALQAFLANRSTAAARLAAGISGQINAISFAAGVMLLSGPLWVVGLEQLVGARRRIPIGKGRISPASLIPLGLWRLLVGIEVWTLDMIKGFASMREAPPHEKVAILSGALDTAARKLQIVTDVSALMIVGCVVAAMVLVVIRRRPRAAALANEIDRSPAAPPFKLSLAILAAALVVLAVAAPLRVENRAPWAPPLRGEDLRVTAPVTPHIDGPDVIERAPVIQVFPDFVALDGSQRDLVGLRDALTTLRTNARPLRPDGPGVASAIVVAGADAATGRLAKVLQIIHDAGFSRVMFAFTRPERLVRPTLGTWQRVWSTAIETTVVDSLDSREGNEESDSEQVRLRAFPTYDQLARAMLATRNRKRQVVLRIDGG